MNYESSNQSSFVRHGSCKSCGSRDNVAWYSNGTGFCFGCGAFHKDENHTRDSKHVHKTIRSDSTILSPPDDLDNIFPSCVIEWVGKYGIGPEQLIRHNILWSASREQLVYQFFGEDKSNLLLWQGRNFKPGTTHKTRFFTQGKPAEVLAVYQPREETTTAVLVEDCISALKVAEAGFVGIPCFSASISPTKLARVAKYYDTIEVWLDYDKFKEAQKISAQALLLGCKSKVVCTMYDPKVYDLKTIKEMIQ